MGWFVCIIGAAWNSTYQALIIASVIVAAHLLLTSKNSSDIKLIVIAAVIGFIFDGLLQINSLIEKLNNIILLLEETQDEKKGSVIEEVILYCFLGIFIIYLVDSFVKVGKYVR